MFVCFFLIKTYNMLFTIEMIANDFYYEIYWQCFIFTIEIALPFIFNKEIYDMLFIVEKVACDFYYKDI